MRSPSLKNSFVDLNINFQYPTHTSRPRMDISQMLNPSKDEKNFLEEPGPTVPHTDLQLPPPQSVRLPPMRVLALESPNRKLNKNYSTAGKDRNWPGTALAQERCWLHLPEINSECKPITLEKDGVKREQHDEVAWSFAEEDRKTLKRTCGTDVVVRKRQCSPSNPQDVDFQFALPPQRSRDQAPHLDERNHEYAVDDYHRQLEHRQGQHRHLSLPSNLYQQNTTLAVVSPPTSKDQATISWAMDHEFAVTDYHHQLQRLVLQNERRFSHDHQLPHRPETSSHGQGSPPQRRHDPDTAISDRRDRSAWNITPFHIREGGNRRSSSPPYGPPPVHASKQDTHYDTLTAKVESSSSPSPFSFSSSSPPSSSSPSSSAIAPAPATSAADDGPKPPHSNKAYPLEAIDFIRYLKDDCHHGWEKILALYLARFPHDVGVRLTNQCLSSRYYRDNNIPLLDPAGKPLFDAKGKLLLDDAKVRERSTPEGKRKGVPFTLVEKHPERAVGYEWVSEEHKGVARGVLRGDGGDGMKAYWRKVLTDLDHLRYAVIWGKMAEDDAKELRKQERAAAKAAAAALGGV